MPTFESQSMSLKPIRIWGHWAGPNPFKVLIIFEALQLKYNLEIVEFSEVKKEPYTTINPNGRLPTIEDPNTGITLWEISGQGPYVGQATWFARFHPEKLRSAIDRFVNESLRVAGVLDEGLRRSGTGWLVGDKCKYADLSFVTWAKIGENLLKEVNRFDIPEKYPLILGLA